MSDIPPPPTTPPAGDSADDDAAAAPTTGGRSKVVVGSAVGLAAVLIGGGAFAYSQLAGGGPQPADVLPAGTDAYVRIDLDPSAGQKVDLFRLLRKIPDAGEALGIEEPEADVRELLVDQIASDCPDLDHERDVEPWLGERIGVGLDGQQALLAVQVTDEEAATDGIATLFACADEEYVLDFAEGYALISNEQAAIDDALDAVRDGETLATAERFTADMSALGEPGVASAWVDLEGLVEAFADDPTFGELDDQTREELEQVGSAAIALRADGSAIELAGVAGAEATGEAKAAPIGDLPDDTAIALSVSGAGDRVEEQWSQLESLLDSGTADTFDFETEVPQVEPPALDPELLEGLDPETQKMLEDLYADDSGYTELTPTEPQDFLDSIEEELNLSLPDDLATLLGDSITLAVGATNLETIPSSSGPGDLSALDIGLRTTGDPDATLDLMQRLADLAADSELELAVEPTDDGAVLATNADAAKALTGGGDLGSSDRFTSVMPFGDDTVGGLYVDVAAILDALLAADPPPDVREDLEQVDPLQAVGVSAAVQDDHARFSLRVSFD